jgi:phosphonoacetaldehyde hydrolase
MASALIFDLAGTVVDEGNQLPMRAFRVAFNQRGLYPTDEQIVRFMGMKKVEHIQRVLHFSDINDQWERLYGRPHRQEDYDQMSQVMEREVLAETQLLDTSMLIEGTLNALSAARQLNLPIGVTTGYSQKIMAAVLNRAKRFGFVPDAAVASDQVQHPRPAPDLILSVCQQLGANPKRAIVVDDSTVGIQAGNKAGSWTIQTICTGSDVCSSIHPFASHTLNEQANIFKQTKDRLQKEERIIANRTIPSVAYLSTEIFVVQTLFKRLSRH